LLINDLDLKKIFVWGASPGSAVRPKPPKLDIAGLCLRTPMI
jgi:hypothetical protein